MPVIIRVCNKNGRTDSIYAPSISWNRSIETTGTFRMYQYPSDVQNFTFVGSVSTRVNWNALVIWQDLPQAKGKTTDEFILRLERSLFYRFFGLGPDTEADAESSYTRLHGYVSYRKGINLLHSFNIGVELDAARDIVQAIGVSGLPLSPDVFPTVQGMTGPGASILGQAIDFRYDSRPLLDYSERGFYSRLRLGIVEGLSGSPSFFRSQFQAKALIPEADWLQGGVRLFWNHVSSPNIPFFYKSSLGGAFLLRGFTADRFVDQGAWTIEIEQRIRLLQTHIYGVTGDWRVDPFIAVGQVYANPSDIFSHIRVTGGLGFRAFVRPNVLGRVDLAAGGEGLKTYVEIGYPF